MRKKLKTLILYLLTPVLCFSQTIYQIDSNSDTIVSVPYEMIKQANVVFVERDMYYEESLLWKKEAPIFTRVHNSAPTKYLSAGQNPPE